MKTNRRYSMTFYILVCSKNMGRRWVQWTLRWWLIVIVLLVLVLVVSSTLWVSFVISSSFPSSSTMPTMAFGMTTPSNHGFCDILSMVTRGGYLWELVMGPAPETYLNITLVMCWMNVILLGVNVDRSMKRSGRKLRFGHIFSWPWTLLPHQLPSFTAQCLGTHVNSLVRMR